MNQRGDTLIEVVFATAVLALIIVLSLSIMNAGTAQSERAVEGTFVRQSIDSQTEMLRYARDAYVNKDAGGLTLWTKIKAQRIPTPLNFSALSSPDGCTQQSAHKAFWMVTSGNKVDIATTGFTQPATYAAPGNGIWIEVTPTDANANYLDFYIYACWDSPGNSPKATTGTVVRLYAPATL